MPPIFQLLLLLLFGVLRSFSRPSIADRSLRSGAADDCTLPHFGGEDRPGLGDAAGDSAGVQRQPMAIGPRLALIAVFIGLIYASNHLVPHAAIVPQRTKTAPAPSASAAPVEPESGLEPLQEPGRPL